MSDTKVKFTFSDGTIIELEGTESFVEKHWEELKLNLKTITPRKISDGTKKQGKRKGISKSSIKRKISYSPIPVDLKGDNKNPSLKKFFEEKSPQNNEEIITLFAYYLQKICQIENMELGHAISCYNEVNVRKSRNIYSMCKNARDRKAFLATGDEPYTFKITIQGENLIEHDLPHQQN